MVTTTTLVDYYAKHLSEVNKNNCVVAKENILNAEGLLLLRKGTRFHTDAVEKILNFHLIKPLDESITIQNPLTGLDIYQRINATVRDYPFVEKMHYFANINLTLEHQCRSLDKYALLMQKITVQSIQQPHEFNQSIMCAWMSLGIAKLMRLSPHRLHSVFLAAIAHDIGMLHIDPEIIHSKGELTVDEWRLVQNHVEIGKLILDRVKGLPEEASRAVREHHERCDGMGYPKGKTGDELSLEGQIVAMSDSLIALAVKELSVKRIRNVNFIPFLQFNSESHFHETYETMINWLRNVGYNEIRSVPDHSIESLLDTVFREEFFLNQWVEIISYIVEAIPENTPKKRLRAVLGAKAALDKTLQGSGLVDVGYIKWLKQIKSQRLEFAYGEVELASLMLREVRWQLRHITRTLKLIYKTNGDLDDDTVRRMSKGFRKLKLLNASYNQTHSNQHLHK